MTVLILFDEEDTDPAPDLLVAELIRRGVAVHRLDPADFIDQTITTAELIGPDWSGSLRHTPDTPDPAGSTATRSINLSTVTGVYYRRPSGFVHDLGCVDEKNRHAANQARLGLGGLTRTTGSWLNQPHLSGYAEYLPVQLSAAITAGLRVPRTRMTNHPAIARCFVREVGRATHLPFLGHDVTDDDHSERLHVTAIHPDECDERIAATVHLLQEAITPRHEIRLIVVDDHAVAARRTTTGYLPTATPAPIRDAVTDLIRRLGLRFATADFLVDHHDDWWFQHCNPNGRWTRVQEQAGLPLTATLADALQRPCAEPSTPNNAAGRARQAHAQGPDTPGR